MQVPAKLQALCDEMRESFSAGQFYVVDIDQGQQGQENGPAGTLVFGMRDSKVPALAARVRAANALGDLIQEPVEAEVLTTPEEELEYLFDRYLRPYIATHDGIVNIETIDEPGKQLWISMEGGCSGCPSSIATLKHGIERTLKQHLPWVERVDTVTEAAEPDFNIALDFSASS